MSSASPKAAAASAIAEKSPWWMLAARNGTPDAARMSSEGTVIATAFLGAPVLSAFVLERACVFSEL